ncbi:hypothetical protein Adt_21045 [Abeliophyllum distichum]|uniref:Uncharacterized protein n=1 Tax=Abeliophyllum distichum TaxID=126358 RepID=A0ABD1SYB1_9LAMI
MNNSSKLESVQGQRPALTKKLNDSNAAQRVTAEALEAANEEKRLLKEDSTSHLLEVARLREKVEVSKVEAEKLRKNLEDSDRRMEKAETEATKFLSEKKELEGKLENAKANFVVNFHHTEAYTNFSNYFSSVGQQEVMAVIYSEHPNLDITFIEAKFSPMDIEDEGEE